MNIMRFLPRFRKACHALPELEQRETWSRREIEAFQLERLNTLWLHAITHVPYYRQLAATAGLPPRFANLAEYRARVPILPKALVRAEPRAFLSARGLPGHWTRTGGSTGSPMSTFWGKDAHLEMLRTRYRLYASWGLDLFAPTAYLWGHSSSLKPGWAGITARCRQTLEDWLRSRLRLSAYHLGRDDLSRYLRQLATFRPAALYGYSRALYLLALEAEAQGFQYPSLKVVFMTGEPAFSYLVEGVERCLGVPAVVEYGTVECGLIAGEARDRTLRVREDRVLAETVLREDGRFDIVVTILDNPSFPLIRYAIEDVTDALLDWPDRGFAVLKNVSGRNNDLIVSRTGRFLHSARFDALFKYQSKGIRRFRVRQHADGSLAVSLEVDGPPAAIDLAGLEQKIRDLVEGYPVRVEVMTALPQTPSGKHRLVLSDLDVARQSPGTASTANGHRDNGKAENLSRALLSLEERGVPLEAGASASASSPLCRKPSLLRQLLYRPGLSFLMEAHNGLSARIAEEAGFEALWASGLSISAAMGVRDSNEASWTQVLEVLEFMSDVTRIPILVDGDTGYGNFNNRRRLVQKLEQRDIGGVCIEDKIFPKTNSFLHGTAQPLAEIDEFCGRIRAGKDAQKSDAFVIIARVEALIAGWGLEEALRRAEAYRRAGADAILIHSAQRHAREVLAFKEEWGDRLPVVIVPTKYYSVPTEVFRRAGFAAVIWANHLMRSCITAMQRTAQQVFEEQTLVGVEDRIAQLAEVFRLQGQHELEEAEKRYLPRKAGSTRALILAAQRGEELGELTESRPRCMVEIAGKPVLTQVADTFRAAGIKDLAVVRGYCKNAVNLAGLTYFDNDQAETTGDVYSLYQALPALEGSCIIAPGHVLFNRYIAHALLDLDADFAIVVDTRWEEGRVRDRTPAYVTCSEGSARHSFYSPVQVLDILSKPEEGPIHGEWIGLLKTSEQGTSQLRELLSGLAADMPTLRSMTLPDLLRRLLSAGKDIQVFYIAGHWLEVGSLDDILVGSTLP
jgi:phosphoenolpyruvate phosphomutase